MDYEALAEVLRANGWDVTVYDTVVGLLDPAPASGVWTIAIDQGGQVLFRATWPSRVPHGERVERDGRTYRLLREETSTLTVATEIASPEDLAPVLDALFHFLQATVRPREQQ
jgi:hypothetical protein